MAYTNPNDWSTPRTDSGEPPSIPTHGNDGMGTGVMWAPGQGIATTDLDRIETNIKGLHTLLCQSGTVNVVVNNPYFSANLIRMWNWVRINNIVFLGIREMTSADLVVNNELQIDPVTVWPAEILPTSDTMVPCIFRKNQNDPATYRPGFFIMPSVNNAAAVCYITNWASGALLDEDGCYCNGTEFGYVGFSDGGVVAGNKKSIPSQTVMYMTDREILSGTTTSTTPAP